MEFLHTLQQFVSEALGLLDLSEKQLKWVQVGLGAIGLVLSLGVIRYFVNLYEFRRRTFFNQIVIGVNILERRADGSIALKLRTLIEGNLGEILDNPILEGLVRDAAKKCTEDNPVIELSDAADHALLLTKIQNAISRIFAKEYVLIMLGAKFDVRWVDFVVTCERYGGIKATKIRVLIYAGHDLELVGEKHRESIVLEAPHHRDRVRTLATVARMSLEQTRAIHGRVEIPTAALS